MIEYQDFIFNFLSYRIGIFRSQDQKKASRFLAQKMRNCKVTQRPGVERFLVPISGSCLWGWILGRFGGLNCGTILRPSDDVGAWVQGSFFWHRNRNSEASRFFLSGKRKGVA